MNTLWGIIDKRGTLINFGVTEVITTSENKAFVEVRADQLRRLAKTRGNVNDSYTVVKVILSQKEM